MLHSVFLPGVGRQLIKRLPLQNDIQVAAQLAVDAQRGGAEDFRPSGLRGSSPYTGDALPVRKACTGAMCRYAGAGYGPGGAASASRSPSGDSEIELHAGIKGHQSVKQRFRGLPVDLAVGIQQRLAGDNLLSQPGRQTLNHGVAILRAAVTGRRIPPPRIASAGKPPPAPAAS